MFAIVMEDHMRTARDAKAMAKSLRESLARNDIALSHSECLEIVARQFGVDNWNILSAKINADAGVHFNETIPILRIFDIPKAQEFYVDFLGFTWDWEHRFEEGLPVYAQVSRASLSLHLSEHHGDGSPGAVVFVRMSGVEEFHRELLAKEYSYNRPSITDAPWGKCVDVFDPFGNTLRFSDPGTRAR